MGQIYSNMISLSIIRQRRPGLTGVEGRGEIESWDICVPAPVGRQENAVTIMAPLSIPPRPRAKTCSIMAAGAKT
jgi:hypothetical protein